MSLTDKELGREKLRYGLQMIAAWPESKCCRVSSSLDKNIDHGRFTGPTCRFAVKSMVAMPEKFHRILLASYGSVVYLKCVVFDYRGS